MNFNWQSFKEEEFVVQCNTEEKAINFLNECENQGLNVLDSMKSGGSSFFEYGEDTCYRVDMQCDVHYGSKSYYERHCRNVVEWSKQEQPKTIRSVLENIQEGETYQAVGDRYISCKDGKITIGTDSHSVTFLQNEYFRKVKEVGLATAIEYMKQGGRATCLSNGCEYKIIDGKIKGVILNGDIVLTLKQIESKWLIEE